MLCLFETTAIERHQKHLQLLSFINSTQNHFKIYGVLNCSLELKVERYI